MPASVNDTLKKAIDELGSTHGFVVEKASADEIMLIIKQHALGAAASGLAGAWIPGAGSTAAVFAAAGFVLSMYYRINKRIGLKLSKTLIKSLASVILTTIVANAIGLLGGAAASTALSFIPGVGSVAASLIMAGINYAVIFTAGLIYIKLLTGLFKAGKNPAELTEEQFKAAAKSVIKNENISKIIKEARNDYVAARKSGAISGDEKIDIEEDDDELEENICACGAALDPSAKFCSSCGAAVAKRDTCDCGAKLEVGMKFCSNCGAKI